MITYRRSQLSQRQNLTLREKCPNTELFLVRVSCIRTKYKDLQNLRIQSEYRKIRTRNNYVFGHFPGSGNVKGFVRHEREAIIRGCKKIFKITNQYFLFPKEFAFLLQWVK